MIVQLFMYLRSCKRFATDTEDDQLVLGLFVTGFGDEEDTEDAAENVDGGDAATEDGDRGAATTEDAAENVDGGAEDQEEADDEEDSESDEPQDEDDVIYNDTESEEEEQEDIEGEIDGELESGEET